MEEAYNRLVLIGNGFDLANGLKTSYCDFLNWYMCDAFEQFNSKGSYSDMLIQIKNKYSGYKNTYNTTPSTCEEVLDFIGRNDNQSLTYQSSFFKAIIDLHGEKKWVDIEVFYFQMLKGFFLNSDSKFREMTIKKLNKEFDFFIIKLTEYINIVNDSLSELKQLPIQESASNLKEIISFRGSSAVKFLNFNYTETLLEKDYAYPEEVIHIHGRAKEADKNPIIFGYGDESDPEYQKIEDSGINIYLEHMKSFGYFQTDNYSKLISLIDSRTFNVYIVGHSCGLSDRVLLNQIFEHQNCNRIEIFYHKKKDGTDNFKEITQEISRHFKPQNKFIMRRKVKEKENKNFIPQNNSTSASS